MTDKLYGGAKLPSPKHELDVPRKHRQQMTAAEIDDIENAVAHAGISKIQFTSHTQSRMAELHLDECDILTAINQGSLIEARPDGRVVMRLDEGETAICVCLRLSNRVVISVWVNSTSDKHYTLNLSAYTWRGDARQCYA